MPEVNTAMQTLTAQWYNAMVTGLELSDQSFQLYQGPNSLMSTSQAMWDIFNAVPPEAVNNYYNPAQANNFASDYNLILEALVAASDTNFVNCLGDYYGDWMNYCRTNPAETKDASGFTKLFTDWAMMNAPEKAGCVTAWTKILINPISRAIVKFANAKDQYAWNQTIDALQSALAAGASKSFTMDSSTSEKEVQHTWAKGRTSVFFDIFSFGAGGGYDKLTTKAISSKLVITAEFEKVTTFAAGPYAQEDKNNHILSKYSPWYDGSVLSTAYTTKDNTVWNNQKPTTWDKAFGPNGFLQRMTTAIVAADGVKITMTSSATYDSSEQTQINAAAKRGLFPFFCVSGHAGYDKPVEFHDNGSFTATTVIPRGNPQILGILQTPISKVF